MSDPVERTVEVGGCTCRVMEKGDGEPLGFLAGIRGVPRWTPFLDELATSRRVVVPSVPGFPGAEPGHRQIDETTDWITMTLDLLEAAGLAGADLVGESVGGMLAAEAAVFARATVSRLVLIAPFGLYDDGEPARNPFRMHQPQIPTLLVDDLDAYAAAFGVGGETEQELVEHEIALMRADEATARLIWPFGDRGIAKRLHRITQPTLVVWGANDRLLSPAYAGRFAERISGPVKTEVMDGAGHLVTIDRPHETAGAVLAFLDSSAAT